MLAMYSKINFMEVHPNYGLSKSKEASLENSEPVNLLPRSVLRSNDYVLLNGEWQFAIDQLDAGIAENWHLGHTYNSVAQWPGSIEQHMAAAKGEVNVPAWKDKVVAWYERTFPMPTHNEAQKQTSILQLTFGACGYKTQVWLNGIPLATIEGKLVHLGEYTSFSYELPAEALTENNRLTVRIEDDMDADTTRGKQESHVYKRGGIWYQTYTGAVRDILGRNG